MFSVYILLCADGSFYVGQTRDLPARLKVHQAGVAAGFTRQRRPVHLVLTEAFSTRAGAVRRERQLKGWTHAKKEALIRGDLDRLRRLSRSRDR